MSNLKRSIFSSARLFAACLALALAAVAWADSPPTTAAASDGTPTFSPPPPPAPSAAHPGFPYRLGDKLRRDAVATCRLSTLANKICGARLSHRIFTLMPNAKYWDHGGLDASAAAAKSKGYPVRYYCGGYLYGANETEERAFLQARISECDHEIQDTEQDLGAAKDEVERYVGIADHYADAQQRKRYYQALLAGLK